MNLQTLDGKHVFVRRQAGPQNGGVAAQLPPADHQFQTVAELLIGSHHDGIDLFLVVPEFVNGLFVGRFDIQPLVAADRPQHQQPRQEADSPIKISLAHMRSI